MWRLNRLLALAPLMALAACGWSEAKGDFTYWCADSFHPLDGPHCEHRLTDHYLLRYGEGSGDNIILAYQHRPDGGSGGLFDFSQRGTNIVRRLALDDVLLVAQIQSGGVYVAPAHPDRWPQLVGPLSEEEFTARYPNAPPWRDVQ